MTAGAPYGKMAQKTEVSGGDPDEKNLCAWSNSPQPCTRYDGVPACRAGIPATLSVLVPLPICIPARLYHTDLQRRGHAGDASPGTIPRPRGRGICRRKFVRSGECLYDGILGLLKLLGEFWVFLLPGAKRSGGDQLGIYGASSYPC